VYPYSQLQNTLRMAWATVTLPDVVLAEAGRTMSAESSTSQRVEDYERASGARVYLWTAPSVPRPAVTFAQLDKPDLLTGTERAEIASGTAQSIRRLVFPGRPEAIPVDVQSLGGGTSSGDGSRTVDFTTWAAGGRVWEAYAINPIDRPVEGLGVAALKLDPRTAEGRAALTRYARGLASNLIVVGPVDGPPTLLRLPRGGSEDSSAALLELMWPERFGSTYGDQSLVVSLHDADVPSAVRSLGSWALAGGAGRTVNGEVVNRYPSGSSVNSDVPTIIAVAVFDRHPAEAILREQFGSTPWRRIQTWIAVRLLPLLGAVGVLFLASLIASPAAFVYERRVTAEREAEREKERIQREAHERVFGRLGELSSRVEQADSDTSARLEAQLGSVASEIDATLADLKDILGPGTDGSRDDE
jgi:hypothetical protein